MQEPSKETTGSARDASEDVLPAAEADVGQPETLQDNDVGHMEDQSMEDQSMVSINVADKAHPKATQTQLF